MQSFNWNENYITGLTEVDEQHHHLVDLINTFGDKITEDKLVKSDIDTIIKELTDYTNYHFTEEEEMMVKSNIDKRHLDAHIDMHKDFLESIQEMYEKISIDDQDSVGQLLDFLIHWLAYHILFEDQNMARQIKAINEGSTPSDAYDAEEKSKNSATQPLLTALNGLFYLLSSRNKQLATLNKSLEEKVEQRTKDLLEANRHLEELALTDDLTGLPNRLKALRSLSTLWEEPQHTNFPLACMMIDADYFKEVNDNYGHDAGDKVLRILGRTLKNTIRNDDTICRLGGDEFLIICQNTNDDGLMYVAELLQKAVSDLSVSTGDGEWHGSISIGVAMRSPEMKNYEELIKAADQAVYQAKKDGRGCIRKK